MKLTVYANEKDLAYFLTNMKPFFIATLELYSDGIPVKINNEKYKFEFNNSGYDLKVSRRSTKINMTDL